MKTILIIEDSKIVRMILKDIISKIDNFKIEEAQNYIEAINKLSKIDPDIVILDLIIPESFGLNLISHIRKNRKKTKVIVCSVIENKKTIIQAIELGAKDYIIKPFTEQKIIESIKNLL